MIPYIDMHCDTLMKAWIEKKKDISKMSESVIDIERLVAHRVGAQFFAIFMPPIEKNEFMELKTISDAQYIEECMKIFQNTCTLNQDKMIFAKNDIDLKRAMGKKKLAAFLTLEDGRAVDGDMDKLEAYYKAGIRLISLTWNHQNCFGAPNSRDVSIMSQGLTSFGKDAIERMNQLGMIIDVSHLSDGGFYDVAKISSKPFVASHSNCRALSPHQRNLTDDMIGILASQGGVIGINFYSAFLNADITSEDSTIDAIVAHIKHLFQKGGIECIGIGTDFDGMDCTLEIDSIENMQLLFNRLEKEGFTTEQIEQIAYGNMRRVIADTMK